MDISAGLLNLETLDYQGLPNHSQMVSLAEAFCRAVQLLSALFLFQPI